MKQVLFTILLAVLLQAIPAQNQNRTTLSQTMVSEIPKNRTTLIQTQGTTVPTDPAVNTLCYRCKCPSANGDTVNCVGANINLVPTWDLEDKGDGTALTVDFSMNMITALTEEMFPARQDVVHLILDRNNISFVGPYSFCLLSRLSHLSLSGNSLDTINPRAFSSCQDTDVQLPIKILDLSANNLHTLDDDLFDDLNDLQELYLSENLFVSFDTATMTTLNKLHSLQILDISSNKIKDIYDGLSTPVKTLSVLNMAGNLLTTVPSVLKFGEKLTDLNLNENMIRMVNEDAFRGLEKLQVLNMSVMPELEVIEGRAFEPLASLQHLRCSYNFKLKYIHPQVFGSNQPPLVEVDLSENYIQTLDENVFKWWNGDNLNLQNNPFFCDCHVTWIKLRNINPELMGEIRCGSGPAELTDRAFIELDPLLFGCDIDVDEYADDPVVAGLVIVAFLSVLVVFVAVMAIMRYKSWPLGKYATVHVKYTKAQSEDYRRL